MNPFLFSSLVNPRIQPDWREAQKHSYNSGLDYSLSRTFYRIVSAFDKGR
ncbi:MAG: hypothetical protein ABJM29_20980 [Rhizobiaceae bacterium]